MRLFIESFQNEFSEYRVGPREPCSRESFRVVFVDGRLDFLNRFLHSGVFKFFSSIPERAQGKLVWSANNSGAIAMLDAANAAVSMNCLRFIVQPDLLPYLHPSRKNSEVIIASMANRGDGPSAGIIDLLTIKEWAEHADTLLIAILIASVLQILALSACGQCYPSRRRAVQPVGGRQPSSNGQTTEPKPRSKYYPFGELGNQGRFATLAR
jgi:hypothetical protein